MRRPWLQPVLTFGGIVAIAVAIHLPALLYARPFCCDNLTILEWAHQASLRDVLVGDAKFPLEWRPLSHVIFWAQYQLWGVGTLVPYLLLNLTIWAGAVWCFFRLARAATQSTVAAAIGASFILTARATVTLSEFVMETQNGMACLFGLAALNLAFLEPPSRSRTVGVGALLLLAGLGKEYGLAFAAGLLIWSVVKQRRDLAAASGGALVIYLALRVFTTHAGPLCDQHAFLGTYRDVCMNSVTPSTAVQMVYNAGVGLAQTVFPGFFGPDGLISVAPRQVVESAFWLALIVAGIGRGPLAALALVIVAASALLQAPLVRSRNTVVGVTMLALVLAFGVQHLREWCGERGWSRTFRVLCAGIALVLVARAVVLSQTVRLTAQTTAIQDPCVTLHQNIPVGADFVSYVKQVYGLRDVTCQQPAVERVLGDEDAGR